MESNAPESRPSHLVIVPRPEMALYERLRQQLGSDPTVEVILDRRTGERRSSVRPAAAERRVRDRRRPASEVAVVAPARPWAAAPPSPAAAGEVTEPQRSWREVLAWGETGARALESLRDVIDEHRQLRLRTLEVEGRKRQLEHKITETLEQHRTLLHERAELLRALGRLSTPGEDVLAAVLTAADVAAALDVRARGESSTGAAFMLARIRHTLGDLLMNVRDARRRLETLRSSIGAAPADTAQSPGGAPSRGPSEGERKGARP